jgi:zinc transporter ZupT
MEGSLRLFLAIIAVIGLTLAGGLLPLAREWSRSTLRMMLAFGTGVLLGAAFFHMLPEAVHGLGDRAGVAVLAGFLVIYVLERFVMMHPCEEEGCSFHHMGMAAFAGISLHALIDGLALGAGVAIPHLSLAVTAAIVLHKLPAAVSLTGILLHCDYPRKRIVPMIVGFALATPIGAVISFFVLRDLTGPALPVAIGFSAGTFLAIATADLLPQIHSPAQGRFRNLAALFAGLALISLAGAGHGHGASGAAASHGHSHHPHDHDEPVGSPEPAEAGAGGTGETAGPSGDAASPGG